MHKYLSPHRLKLATNTGWLLFSKIFRIGVGLWVGTWVARHLGPDRFGVLEYAIAYSSFFLPLSTAQMSPVITRQLVRQPQDSAQILGTAVLVQFLGGILAFAATVVSMGWLSPNQGYARYLVAFIALKFLFNSLQPLENWFEAQVNSKFVVFASNIAFVLLSIARIGLIQINAPLVWFAILVGSEGLIYSAGLLFFYIRDRQSQIRQWQTSLPRIRALLRASLPLCLSSTAVMIYSAIDQVMLGNLFSNETVGIYASAVRLSAPWSFLPTIVCSSLYPSIIAAQDLDPLQYQQKLQRVYDLLAGLAYGIIVSLVPLAGVIIQFFYGEAFAEATPILMIHLWINLFVFLGIAQSRWIVSEDLQIYNLYAKLLGLAINIGLNLVLIPRYQGGGAAIATLIAAIISNYLFFSGPPATRISAKLMTKALFIPVRLVGQLITNP